MTTRLFVDESKQRDYLLVVTAFPPDACASGERALRGLLRRGQSRLHMKNESDPTRRAVLSAIGAMRGVRTTVLIAGRDAGHELDRRRRCLLGLIDLAADQPGTSVVVLDRDPSRERDDRQVMFHRLRAVGAADRVAYQHASAAQVPLLAVPDAIAWAYARGGDWRRRCGPLTVRPAPSRTAQDPSAASVRTGLGSTSRR